MTPTWLSPRRCERAVERARPSIIVTPAAYTAVDRAEAEPDLAWRINAEAPAALARAAATLDATLIHVSTDFVFDGQCDRPYRETDPVGPVNVYGRSKLGGERRALASPRALVVRRSAVFGHGGANFVDTIAARLRRGEGPLRVVDDQVTAPTYAPFLARALADLGESAATGLVHYRNREPVSWYELARAVARELASDLEIVPVPTAEFPRPARRPARSVLAVEKFEATCGRRVEPWPTRHSWMPLRHREAREPS